MQTSRGFGLCRHRWNWIHLRQCVFSHLQNVCLAETSPQPPHWEVSQHSITIKLVKSFSKQTTKFSTLKPTENLVTTIRALEHLWAQPKHRYIAVDDCHLCKMHAKKNLNVDSICLKWDPPYMTSTTSHIKWVVVGDVSIASHAQSCMKELWWGCWSSSSTSVPMKWQPRRSFLKLLGDILVELCYYNKLIWQQPRRHY